MPRLLLALATLALVVAFAIVTLRGGAGQELQAACGELIPGDTKQGVLDRMGPQGLRDEPFCDGGECSLLWRRGQGGCLAEFDGPAGGLLRADWIAYSAP